jgi:putative addiction module component (TIGR02574 family)
MALPKLDVDALTPAERLQRIERLWDSLDEGDVPLTDARQAELARGLADLQQRRATRPPPHFLQRPAAAPGAAGYKPRRRSRSRGRHATR